MEGDFLDIFSVVFLGIGTCSAAHPARLDCAIKAAIGEFHLITGMLALASKPRHAG
jgi:hypothetical protein